MGSVCLVTNDDGDTGLLRNTIEIVRLLVDRVVAVTPNGNRTGCGAAITLNAPVKIERARQDAGVEVYCVSTYPADGVRYALRELCPSTELIVSGINNGSNLGFSVVNSGTVGAAMEGARFGVSGICLSAPFDMREYSKEWLLQVADVLRALMSLEVLREYGPAVVNVNLPSSFCKPLRMEMLPLSRVSYEEWYEPHGNESNLFVLRGHRMVEDPDVPDLRLLSEGVVVLNLLNSFWTREPHRILSALGALGGHKG